ncbi:MAG: C39 family peptidase [Chloroflexi bacterium]|nr:C39 family peptidase [Chloroflexota bacterium]
MLPRKFLWAAGLVAAAWPALAPSVQAAGSPNGTFGFQDPPPYEQHMESDCEAAAASLAFSMLGENLSEAQIMARVPTDPRPPEMRNGQVVRWGSPEEGFVGNPNGWLPWLPGAAAYGYAYGIYATPLAQALQAYDPIALGGTHIDTFDLKALLAAGHAVVVWLPDQTFFRTERIGPMTGTWTTWDGQTVPYAYREHAQVLLSYGPNGYRVANIGYEQSHSAFINVWSDAEFERGYALLDDMALVL